MLSVLVFIAGAVISEAGIIRQSNVGFGLSYHIPISSRVVRPALIKSHIVAPLGTALNNHSPTFTSSRLTSPLVLNSAPTSYAALTPLPSFHRASVPISLRAIRPALTTHISQPITISSGSLIPTVASRHISPPVVLKSAPAFGPASTITHISPSTVINPAPQSSNAATIQNYEIVHEEIHEVPEKSISYSISENDYHFLKRHKVEGQDSPYNPVPGFETASQSEKHNNHHTHHNQDVPNKISESETLLKQSAASNAGNSYQGYSEPSFINGPEPVVTRTRNAATNAGNSYQGYSEPIFINAPEPVVTTTSAATNAGNSYQEYSEPSFINVSEPVVTKHIYFHVPPPDFEEPPSIPISESIPLRKKTYNIVFIKVPDQQQSNNAYLQQLLESRQSQVEDKTLIYVLSKNQELPPPVVLPPQNTSSPEVFFVKYKTKLGDTSEISNEIIDGSSLDNISPLVDQKR